MATRLSGKAMYPNRKLLRWPGRGVADYWFGILGCRSPFVMEGEEKSIAVAVVATYVRSSKR